MASDDKSDLDIMFERRNQEANLLFSRLNYFLVGTSFLVAGFIGVLHISGCVICDDVKKIGYAVGGMGLLMSVLFFVVNYVNTEALGEIDKYIDVNY